MSYALLPDEQRNRDEERGAHNSNNNQREVVVA